MPVKEAFYFSHDYNSRSDPKMIYLLMTKGIIGIGVYWCIVEMLYEQGGYIKMKECERIAFELRTECQLIRDVMASELFLNNGEIFWSESVIKRLNERKIKSATARESANIRWGNANALHSESDTNAIKERKGKERKRNNKGFFEKIQKGTRFDGDKVYFPDDTSQKLTLSQQSLLSMGELKPEQIVKQ